MLKFQHLDSASNYKRQMLVAQFEREEAMDKQLHGMQEDAVSIIHPKICLFSHQIGGLQELVLWGFKDKLLLYLTIQRV